MRTLVLGSRNRHKLREVQAILEGAVAVRPLPDGAPEAPEEGATFEENACSKALFYAAGTGALVAADDSGLVVDALGGEPGVRSARYAGPDADGRANNEKLLSALARVSDPARRTARFLCVVALARPGEVLCTVRGAAEGRILAAPEGEGGFGYDPVFFSFDLGRSFARALPAEKNAVSHRGRAFASLRRRLLAGPHA